MSDAFSESSSEPRRAARPPGAYKRMECPRGRFSPAEEGSSMATQKESLSDQERTESKSADSMWVDPTQRSLVPSVQTCRKAFEQEFMREEKPNSSSPAVSSSSDEEDSDEEVSEEELLREDQESSSSSSAGSERGRKRCRVTSRVLRHTSRKNERFLSVYTKPPKPWPADMPLLQRREGVFFQRKMRAFRNLKNHILTADLAELIEEAERKHWGEVPEFVKKRRPKYSLTHLEVLYYFWPQPFEEIEKMWLTRHFKEFAAAWQVHDDDVVHSKLLTPYMKYIRCYPHEALLQIRKVTPPRNRPSRRQLGIPMTGANIILDAKAVLTYYGLHRLKEWEVHDNVDFEMLDFSILIEEVGAVAKRMMDRIRAARKQAREMRKKGAIIHI